MNEKDRIRTSKFLSLVLRHRPGILGLSLEQGGWVAVFDVIEAARGHRHHIDEHTVRQIVESCPKKRFSLSDDGNRIRANYGHSIPVDLDLVPVRPPEILYHGTARHRVESIKGSGINRRKRQYVHLSATRRDAVAIGTRHGEPVVLVVRSLEMHEEGMVFFQTESGIWLTGHVPERFLKGSSL